MDKFEEMAEGGMQMQGRRHGSPGAEGEEEEGEGEDGQKSGEGSGDELNLDEPGTAGKSGSPKRSGLYRGGGAGVDEEELARMEKARQESEEAMKKLKETVEKLQEQTSQNFEELRKSIDDQRFEISSLKTDVEQQVKKAMLAGANSGGDYGGGGTGKISAA